VATRIRIQKEILQRLKEEAQRNPAEECCGLLAGRSGVVTAIYPAANALGSATAFEIAPAELFRLFREMRAEALEMLGIYHSHPFTENRPSARDIECAYYPDAAYVVLSPLPAAAEPVRAFSIHEGKAEELVVEAV
jgi:proteasome lid subunit RPN8/RPN11